MNDRELLELAAKAAGMDGYTYICVDQSGYECMAFDEGGSHSDYWNPLTDDGDALRLAAKLDIHITPRSCIYVGLTNGSMGHTFLATCEIENGDKSAAWRRAIVRAAAEIGKVMP